MTTLIEEPSTTKNNSAQACLSGTIQRDAFYLQCGEQTLFAWRHTLAGVASRDHGVIICPPIGFEQLHAQRSLRHLADAFARLNIPTLRFDWHGTGDSSGDDIDADRLSAWLANAQAAINWMKHEGGCNQISVVGLRFGATLAALALDQIEIDNLVLWAPVTTGRGSVREMHVIDMMSEGHSQESAAAGAIEAAGFRMTAETSAALSKTSLLQSKPRCQRVLMANRDDAPADQRVIDHFTKLGVGIAQLAVAGVSEMLIEPHKGQVPESAIQEIVQWIHHLAVPIEGCHGSDVSHPPALPTVMPLTVATTEICERPLSLSCSPNLFGIVSEPTGRAEAKLPTIVLLNAGAAYRIGPGRMNVEMARQFASCGFRTVRLDLCGLGDSITSNPEDENDSYAATAFRDIAIALDSMRKEYGPQKFVLMGLCSGAYASFQAAAQFEDPDLVEAILINPLTYYWRDGMTLETAPTLELIREHYYLSSALQPSKWLKLLSGRSRIGIRGAMRVAAQRFGLIRTRTDSPAGTTTMACGLGHPLVQDLAGDLRKIVVARRQLSMFFSTTDPGYSILLGQARRQAKRMIRRQEMTVTFIDNADHTFSRHAARQRLIDSLCEHLLRRFDARA